MDQTELRNQILSLAVEDYFGLYEIIWQMNEKWSDLEETEKIRYARNQVKSLLQNELIQLFRIEIKGKNPTIIPSKDTHFVLGKSESWQPGTSFIGFAATDKGEKAYFQSPIL
jgi:hypothetical protein